MSKRRLYVITTLLFLVVILVVDKNNILSGFGLRREIRDLKEQRTYFRQRIVEDSVELQRLSTNSYIERVAREQYYMKRADEHIYLIKEED